MSTALKEGLHPCMVETMHIILFMLGIAQSPMPSFRHNGADADFVGTMRSTQNQSLDEVVPQFVDARVDLDIDVVPHPQMIGHRRITMA